MTDATDRAKKLLTAAEHDSECQARRPCEACGLRVEARREIRRLGYTPATLAVAITAIEALLCAPCEETGLYTTRCKSETYCLRCGALAEWENLLKEEA